MSDGRFNRALLPHREYQSGLKVGRAMQRQQCAEALDEALSETVTPEEAVRIKEHYEERLKAKPV